MTVFDEKGCVFDDGEVAEFLTDAGARRAGEGDELADIDDGDHSGGSRC
jgi:hypothetical protein